MLFKIDSQNYIDHTEITRMHRMNDQHYFILTRAGWRYKITTSNAQKLISSLEEKHLITDLTDGSIDSSDEMIPLI